MNSAWKKKIFPSYALSSFVLLLLCFVNVLKHWPIVTWIGLHQPLNYGDANIILKAADCYAQYGSEIFLKTNELCPYNYGQPLLQVLSVLGLGAQHTFLIALFFMISTIFCFLGILHYLSPAAKISFQFFAVLLFTCPPLMLLLERANFDALIFSLACLAIFLKIRGYGSLAILATSLTVLFKFYTFPVLVYLCLIEKNRWKKFFAVILVILSGYSAYSDLQKIMDGFSIPSPMVFSFGASKFVYIFSESLGFENTRFVETLGGLIFFGFILGSFWKVSGKFSELRKMRSEWTGLSLTKIFVLKFLFIIHISVYLTGMSYVYRLVFLIPLISFCNSLGAKGYKYLGRAGVLGFLICFPYPSNRSWAFGGLEIIGEFFILLITTVLAWLFLSGINLVEFKTRFRKIFN